MEVILQEILDGCMRQEEAFQRALYKRYFNLFMTMCLRYVPNRQDAEEVLNNAFLRIFKHIGQYKGKGSFEGWMKKIVVNCCLTEVGKADQQLKSRIIPLETEYGMEARIHAGLQQTNPSDSSDPYQQEFLLQLLRNLPNHPRLVFNLYVFEEYNHREIGVLLNMAERTSQAHLAQARKLLAKELDKKNLMIKMQRV